MESILVTVKLEGILEGCVAHISRQKHTINLSEEFGGSMTKVIKHTDRQELPSVKVFSVAGEHVTAWSNGECPYWEKPSDWRQKKPIHKVISHVLRFDEGFGVSFEFLGDRED